MFKVANARQKTPIPLKEEPYHTSSKGENAGKMKPVATAGQNYQSRLYNHSLLYWRGVSGPVRTRSKKLDRRRVFSL